MDENVRFWDNVTVYRNEVDPEKRVTFTRVFMQTFVLDTTPFRVNQFSRVRDQLVDTFKKNDKLNAIGFRADACHIFMESDTFLTANLSQRDPNIVDSAPMKG